MKVCKDLEHTICNYGVVVFNRDFHFEQYCNLNGLKHTVESKYCFVWGLFCNENISLLIKF